MFSQVEELLPVISFGTQERQARPTSSMPNSCERMIDRGYTERQVRRLVEWYMRVNKAG